jgi:multicomponent Na+:H+ antiporter subunit G
MTLAVEIISGICLLAGAIFCVIGGIGILRLPDLYARTHAATITDTLGAGLMLLGLMGYGGLSLVTVKLILIGILLWITSPTIAHALVKAAHAQGVRAEEGEDDAS